MSPIPPIPPAPAPAATPLDAALAALDDAPSPDGDAFTEGVLRRLDDAAAAEAAATRDWMSRAQAASRRERRLRRFGALGVAAGVACVGAGVAVGAWSGAAAWSPLAVFAVGLTTVVAAWAVAGRGA